MVARGRDGNRTWFAVDAAAETLRVSTVGRWRQGTRVNLERALKVGEELGGHIVAGHADGLAAVIEREDLTDMARLILRAPAELARFVAPKGSVALDGVSLTVNEVAGVPPKVTAVAPVSPVPVRTTVVPPVTGPTFGTTVVKVGTAT